MIRATTYDDRLSGRRFKVTLFAFAVLFSSGVGYLVSEAVSQRSPIELLGDGIASVKFGTREHQTLASLQRLFGTAENTTVSSGAICGVTGTASWRYVFVVFQMGSFAGYRIGPTMDGYRTGSATSKEVPNVATAAGLRIGDTIADASRLYSAFTTSAAEGGAWTVTTSTGRLYGWLVAPPNTGRLDQVDGIAAGSLGCA